MRKLRNTLLIGASALTISLTAATTSSSACGGFWDVGCNVGKAIEKAAQDTGRAVEKGLHDTGRALEKAAQDTGRAVDKAFEDLNHAAREVEKVFCDIATLGQASQGKAGCGVNAGVGVQTNGDGKPQYYTYNPQQPEIHYPITRDQTTLPDGHDLAEMDRLFGPSVPLEDWEKRQADMLGDLLKPGDKIGLPWAGMLKDVHPPAAAWNIRPDGQFMSYRDDSRYPNGRRWHGGLDVINKVGEDVYAIASGKIVRLSNPGRNGMMGVEILTPSGYTISTFYVMPTLEIQAALNGRKEIPVTAGQRIGTAQDLRLAYPASVPQHVHVTVKDSEGRFVDPKGKDLLVMRRGEANQKIPAPEAKK